MTSTSKPKETAKVLAGILATRELSQADLRRKSGYSQSYTSQITTGDRHPPAEWINTVAIALRLSRVEKLALHRAAAIDHGFELD